MYYESPGSKPRCLAGPGHPVDHVHHVGPLAAYNVSNSYITFCKSPDLVLPRSEEVEQRDHGALEFWAAASFHCGGEEGVQHDGLAGVGSNEIKYKL